MPRVLAYDVPCMMYDVLCVVYDDGYGAVCLMARLLMHMCLMTGG